MTSTYEPMLRADALPRPTNGLAIAALVLSLLGCFFLSIPFGFVALHQIKHRAEDGREFAIASLVISALEILLFVAVPIALAFFLMVNSAHPVH